MFSLSEALPIATHILLACVTFAYLLRLALCFDGKAAVRAVQYFAFLPFMILFLTSLLIERLYYAVERILVPTGFDLWNLHPVPEFLSFSIAVGCFLAQAPLIVALYDGPLQPTVRLLIESFVWLAVWAITLWLLAT